MSSERLRGRIVPVQERVQAFVERHGIDCPPEARALDLVAEVGEVAKEVLKGSAYGHTPFTPPPGWAEELADTLFALLCLANSTGVDLDAALDAALAKYETRLAARRAGVGTVTSRGSKRGSLQHRACLQAQRQGRLPFDFRLSTTSCTAAGARADR